MDRGLTDVAAHACPFVDNSHTLDRVCGRL